MENKTGRPILDAYCAARVGSHKTPLGISHRVKSMRQNLPGTSPYEPIIGFSRAVRIGNAIHISGTGPVGADGLDVVAQTHRIFEIAAEVLTRAGSSLKDVVRTRMYLTHVEDWEAVGRVHGEYFAQIRPAATMVVVAQLLNPKWRVEIEFDAVLPQD
jgi:enamine deaminase RidA (YjgF/YER057c/UK114 family)